jgi:hypothetical protein
LSCTSGRDEREGRFPERAVERIRLRVCRQRVEVSTDGLEVAADHRAGEPCRQSVGVDPSEGGPQEGDEGARGLVGAEATVDEELRGVAGQGDGVVRRESRRRVVARLVMGRELERTPAQPPGEVVEGRRKRLVGGDGPRNPVREWGRVRGECL